MKKFVRKTIDVLRARQSQRPIAIEGGDSLKVGIDRTWSDDRNLGVKGWIFSTEGHLDRVSLQVDGSAVEIQNWHPRPDVAAAYPQYDLGDRPCGFIAVVPRCASHSLIFETQQNGRIATARTDVAGMQPLPPKYHSGEHLFDDFIARVNNDNLSVLEIGSRVVSPGSYSKRSLFPKASEYVGFDYYGDDNTDVVGDAHKLSEYFGDRQFDAIFSLSVFEHLAMPWLVSREVNKLLKVGGITFHATHFSFPLHETPWDFWRFSDEGLKVLFSPPLGFETIEAGLFYPVRLHLDRVIPGQEMMPESPGFTSVAILARKTADLEGDRFQWKADIKEVLGDTHYPQKADD